jgi:cytochrome b
VKVWDRFVRIAHWTLAACVLTAWLTGEWKLKSAEWLHEWVGYAVLVVITLRVVWGWTGSRYARFSQFVAGPSRTLGYARALLRGGEPRYIGHNPLGGWMIVALLVTAALAAVSGWLSVTDRYWGVAWMQDLHGALSDVLIALVVLHLAGVGYTSLRHGENLAAAMVRGVKRAPGPGDVA